jgi:uncharacterized oligopeptide transporter (OPT) family protein
MGRNANNELGRRTLLPPVGSTGYYLLLGSVAIFFLGPLAGVAAAYMNFSLGFFLAGQVLAGILGSVVTYGYGSEGKHGANYMQTLAASVGGISGMAILLQAMVWLGMPEPPAWQLILYFTCIGMFGVGIGMLYTPVLVDQMQLTYPSGLAVANILRALTDKNLLQKSLSRLGTGTLAGYATGFLFMKLAMLERFGFSSTAIARLEGLAFSPSTLGAGLVVSARIAVPSLLVALLGYYLTPWLREIGWLGPQDPFRKIGFIIALGTILGAAIVDLSLMAYRAVGQFQNRQRNVAPADDWKRVNNVKLIAWVIGWGIALFFVATQVLNQPAKYVALGMFLVTLFVLVNGIATGISDSNPISSAFVVAVFIMALVGLKDPLTGLMCASILLISCTVGVDMQQDRSTGWRLGSNRVIQFRFQVVGVVMGAILAVVLAKVFMTAYPVLRVDIFSNPNTPGAEQWQSAMTYKVVGAIKGITNPNPVTMKALLLGIGIGFAYEVLRKLLKGSAGYKNFVQSGRGGRTTDFLVDAVLLPSPYASSFGGFVNLWTTIWFSVGGVIASVMETFSKRKAAQPGEGEVPADMSNTSLWGGGLIAGDSLAALSLGLFGLAKTLLK